MTKAEAKKQRREQIINANNEIYKNVANYLMGPKWRGGKYQIGDLKTKSRVFGIIKVGTGCMGGKCSIYFDVDIRIYIKYKYHSGRETNIAYDYFRSDKDYTVLPEDIDDYTFRAKRFLKELLRHISCLDGFEYGMTNVDSYEQCVNIPKPENFNIPFGMVNLLKYEYNWENTEAVDYMIAVMKSKKFKRYRGDN